MHLYCNPRAKPRKACRHSLTKDKLKESKYNSETPIEADQSFHGSIPELTNVWVDCDNSDLMEAGDFNASDSGIGSPGSDHFSGKPVDPNQSLTTTEDQSHSEKPEESFVEEFEIDFPATDIEHVNSSNRVVSEDSKIKSDHKKQPKTSVALEPDCNLDVSVTAVGNEGEGSRVDWTDRSVFECGLCEDKVRIKGSTIFASHLNSIHDCTFKR